MIFATSLLDNCWEFITRHPGILLVLLGVTGEVIFDWKEMKGRLAWAKRLSAIVLIAGLVLEFSEAAKSDKEVAIANERVSTNELQVAKLNLRVEELRKQNDKLEAKQRRIISLEQRDNFIKILKDRPKTPVKIYVGEQDSETRIYAHQIRMMLDEVGYGTGKTNDIIEYSDFGYISPIGDPGAELPICFIFFGTPNEPIDWPGLKIIPDKKGGETVSWDKSEVRGVSATIWDAFKQIGIYPAFGSRTNWFDIKRPGDWGIFIPERF